MSCCPISGARESDRTWMKTIVIDIPLYNETCEMQYFLDVYDIRILVRTEDKDDGW